MSKNPTLYLKWKAFRGLIEDRRSDADIARIVFENEDQSPQLFSRLLHGDASCRLDIASRLVEEVINECVAAHRRAHGHAETKGLSAGDLWLPSYEFVRKLVAAAGTVTPSKLDALEQSLLHALAPPGGGSDQAPKLAIRRFDKERSFAGLVKSGGEGPIEFEPGLHMGQVVIEDLAEDPQAIYAFWTRNPYPLSGKRLWELDWGDTVLWLPSPIKLPRTGNTLTLTPLREVMPTLGRFVVTAVLVFDEEVLEDLDPRGTAPVPAALDESQTARFITNMRRLENPAARRRTRKWRSKGPPLQIAANEYIVTRPREQMPLPHEQA
jgi:hypothetical protein